MLQDIAPFQFKNQYHCAKPCGEDRAIIVRDDMVLMKTTGNELAFPQFCELPQKDLEAVFLFSVSESKLFLVCNQSDTLLGSMPHDLHYIESSTLRDKAPKYVAFTAAVACQLARWYQANRYCGHCGNLLAVDQKERALRCRHCDNVIYPKICPAVIVAVIHEDKIILTKYAGVNGTRYALVAGFAEIGETIEETVQREVMEEIGVHVKNIQYYKSQPWPISDTLLLGFFCGLDGKDTITMDTKELSYAAWVARKDMKIENDSISLTGEMLAQFRDKGAAVLKL